MPRYLNAGISFGFLPCNPSIHLLHGNNRQAHHGYFYLSISSRHPPRAMHTHHLEILHCTSPHYHVGLGNRNLPQIDKTFCQVLLVPPHKSTIVLSWHLKCPSCPHTDKVLCPEVYYARQTMHSLLALGRCVGRQGKVRDIVPSKI